MVKGWSKTGLGLVASSVVLTIASPGLAQTAILAKNNDTTGFDVAATRVGVFLQDRNVSVRNRPHPGYDPVPYRLSSFLLSPSLTTSLDYDDNLLASPSLKRSSAIVTFQPVVLARSDWSAHYLEAIASGNFEKHTSHGEEDRNQYLIGSRGRYDIDSSTSLQGGASYERRAEPRTASTAPVTDRPISYYRTTAFVGATKGFNRLRLLGFGKLERLAYNNATLNGLFIDQNFRDRTTLSFNAQAEYSLAPGYNFVLTTVIDHRNATQASPGNPERDSTGVDVQAGASFDIGGLATGSATIGYIDRKYRLSIYPNVKGVTFSAGIDYYATPLLTVRGLVIRDVEDATVSNSSGFLETAATVHADYEIERNIILTAGGGIGRNSFKGISRNDDRRVADANVRWIINRSIEAGLHYALVNQDSKGSQQGRSFTENRVGVSLTYRGSL